MFVEPGGRLDAPAAVSGLATVMAIDRIKDRAGHFLARQEIKIAIVGHDIGEPRKPVVALHAGGLCGVHFFDELRGAVVACDPA